MYKTRILVALVCLLLGGVIDSTVYALSFIEDFLLNGVAVYALWPIITKALRGDFDE